MSRIDVIHHSQRTKVSGVAVRSKQTETDLPHYVYIEKEREKIIPAPAYRALPGDNLLDGSRKNGVVHSTYTDNNKIVTQSIMSSLVNFTTERE